jgi:hypothetical protein
VADFDNDGFDDIYVTNFGANILYRNESGRKFQDISQKSQTDHKGWSTGATWADFDRDGWLDLYVARYVDFDIKSPPQPGSAETCKYLGLDIACGPRGLKGARGVYFRNLRDGTFRDETSSRGLTAPLYYGLGVCAGDYDDDGDPDLFVANDSTPNFLFRNRGGGIFDEVALASGVAFNEDGNAQACMGTDFADYDNDGRLDLIVTNFSRDTNTIYHNEGRGQFSDATTRTGQRDGYPYMKWGVGFVDFNNDGWKDLYVVNGHLYPQVDSLKNEIGYRQADLLYLNGGKGRFENSSARLTHRKHVGRGAAFGDLNSDGLVDVVISSLEDTPNVLINRDKNPNNWIQVRCRGTRSNRDAIGARVSITTDAGTQVAEVKTGCSYLSSSDRRIHFGLGQSTSIKNLQVRWPSGSTTELKGIGVNRLIEIQEPRD